MISIKNTILNFLVILFFTICNNLYSQSIYTNNMDYVLGDAKQVFIRGNITTTNQADNLLKGFINMKVNGIRIPIFGRDINGVDLNPNKPMMDYFYDEVVKAGIPIFANPAQGGGGARIANNMLNGESTPSVNNRPAATAELIARMLEFSNEYPNCKWLNPFNEDGRATNSTWTIAQINEIYATLYNNVNGAELIGPCTWGLVAGIDMLERTNIADYITVAATHNLGFNHNLWNDFITLARAENLPIWDSEVNNFDKFANDASRPLQQGTRIDKALENNIDGLVIYDSGLGINLTNGNVGTTNEGFMSKYLKQRTNIALNGIATQSQTTTPKWILEASRAIDGDISGSFAGGNGSISHTTGTNPWWQVDLSTDKEIGEIKIYNRTDASSKQNLSNFTVSVINNNGNEVFSETFQDYPDQSLTIETGNIMGRIVKVQINATRALTLAEVEVFEHLESMSLSQTENQVNLNIYPNPVINSLKINGLGVEIKNYSLYSVNGQKVSKGENLNTEALDIDTSKLSKGLYMLKIEGDNYSLIRKIIKK